MLDLTKGTHGRVYGGSPDLLHFKDGTRVEAGVRIADYVDRLLRYENDDYSTKALCPGCYMVAMVNAAVTLAERNGQSVTELARSMANAFALIAKDPVHAHSEHIRVMLDPDDDEEPPFRGAGPGLDAARVLNDLTQIEGGL